LAPAGWTGYDHCRLVAKETRSFRRFHEALQAGWDAIQKLPLTCKHVIARSK
jgi:hypothetical protein